MVPGEEHDNPMKRRGVRDVLGILVIAGAALYLGSAALCGFISDRFNDDFNRSLATAIATNPNLAAPGDCGQGFPCVDAIQIDTAIALDVGDTAGLGNFTVTVLEAGPIAAEGKSAEFGRGYSLWRIDYRLEYVAKEGAHYGGPLHEWGCTPFLEQSSTH